MSPTAAATAASDDLGPLVDEITAEGVRDRAGEWTLSLFAEATRVSNERESLVYTRREIANGAKLMLFGEKTVLVLPDWKTGLTLDSVATELLRRWMAPELRAWAAASSGRDSLGSILGGLVSVGLFWYVGAFVLLAFGITSIADGVAKKVRPGPSSLLFSAARTVISGLALTIDMLQGRLDWWWSISLVLSVIVVRATLVKYRFFTRSTVVSE